MEPIVNPWLIYGIEMLQSLGIAINILCVVSTIAFIVMLIASGSSDFSEEDRKNSKKYSHTWGIIAVILMLTSVLLPSRETAYKMLMASYVTPNNIHMVGKEANEAVGVLLDNITNHMKELKDNK